MAVVDTHAHVFTLDLPLAPDRRYSPERAAPLADYLALLDRHGVDCGVLVQPSFLGTDNSHMLACLRRSGGRLRGVAVLDPAVGDGELERLEAAGIVGIRFNLLGRPRPIVLGPREVVLARRVAALGWQLEVQVEGRDIPPILNQLAGLAAPLVLDHFGRPDSDLGLWCPGFQSILRGPGNVHVKISAPYRLGTSDIAPYLAELVSALGPDRLLWGSDWPWTQHERGRDYGELLAIVQRLPYAERIHANALALFRFEAGAAKGRSM